MGLHIFLLFWTVNKNSLLNIQWYIIEAFLFYHEAELSWKSHWSLKLKKARKYIHVNPSSNQSILATFNQSIVGSLADVFVQRLVVDKYWWLGSLKNNFWIALYFQKFRCVVDGRRDRRIESAPHRLRPRQCASPCLQPQPTIQQSH